MPYLIITSLVWAFSFSLIKTYLASFDSFLISFIRLFISFLVFLPFVSWKRSNRMVQQFLIGSIQFGLMYILYIRSYHYLKGHQIALLTITTPIFVIFFSSILTRNWHAKYWLAVFSVLAGSALLVPWSIEAAFEVKGVLMVQAANACFALGQILQKKWGGGHLHRFFAWSYLGGFLVPLIFLLIDHSFSPAAIVSLAPAAIQPWVVLIYLGAISSGLCFFLWNKGVCLVNPGTVSIMNNVKIPLAVLVSFFFFNEHVVWIKLAASALGFGLAFYWTSDKK